MIQYIELVSTDMRNVAKNLLALGALGAEMLDTCPAFKVGPLYTVQVIINDDSKVEYGPTIKKGKTVFPKENVSTGQKYTKEELEEMSISELKEATGIKSRNKQEIIKQYLGS